MTISDIDLVEMYEAFAAQVVPSYRELGVDIGRLNVHGGAIALGHPFGMTGARINATLLNGLVARDKVASAVELGAAAGRGVSGVLVCLPLALRAIKNTVRRSARLTRGRRGATYAAVGGGLALGGRDRERAFWQKRAPGCSAK